MNKFSKLQILTIVAFVVAAQSVAAGCRVQQAGACAKDVIPPGLQIAGDAIPLAEPSTLILLGVSTVAIAMLSRLKSRRQHRSGKAISRRGDPS